MNAAPETAPSLHAGNRVVVTITDIAFGGEVARWNDFVIFVPFVVTCKEGGRARRKPVAPKEARSLKEMPMSDAPVQTQAGLGAQPPMPVRTTFYER